MLHAFESPLIGTYSSVFQQSCSRFWVDRFEFAGWEESRDWVENRESQFSVVSRRSSRKDRIFTCKIRTATWCLVFCCTSERFWITSKICGNRKWTDKKKKGKNITQRKLWKINLPVEKWFSIRKMAVDYALEELMSTLG